MLNWALGPLGFIYYISSLILHHQNSRRSMDQSKMTKAKKVWVDPPSGWLFGFPKLWDETVNPDLNAWLVNEGYPQEEIDRYKDHFHCRFLYEANNE